MNPSEQETVEMTKPPAQFATIIGTMRPKFLVLTLVNLCFVAALASTQGAQWHWSFFSLIVLAGLASHIAVNMFNEFYDWQSGLDAITQRTPFSGGSGSLQQNPQAAKWVLVIAYMALGVLAVIGLYFVNLFGWPLLALGLLGWGVIVSYSTQLVKRPWLCLIAPGLAFGPLMLIGSYIVLTQSIDLPIMVAASLVFFWANNLLLLNQYPDLAADQQVGRFNVVMKLGQRKALWVYQLFLWLPMFLLLAALAAQAVPLGMGLGLAALLIVVPLSRGLAKYKPDDVMAEKYLAMNVLMSILTPVLMTLGLMLNL